MKKIIILVSLLCVGFISNAQIVSTFAGGFSFADGNTISAHFSSPNGICSDSSGNIYVADSGNNRIRKITPLGTVSTLAGSGIAGYADGIATTAQFNNPIGICIDITGNIYTVEAQSHKIRRITPSGVVSTFAGSDIEGYLDGIGTASKFNSPHGLCSDFSGSIYVADSGNNRIRKITPSGVVSTLAGSGSSGPGGFADGIGTSAQFNNPLGLCSDSSGNIYVADTNNNRIRKITSLGLVSTLAGSGVGNYADGIGTSAQFYFPNGLCSDSSGNIYVADTANNRIRKITPLGVVTTFAGSTLASSFQGYADGTGTAAQFRNPVGVCSSSTGNIYVTDTGNQRIRKITSSGVVSTFAGTTLSDGVNITSRFNNPYGVCSDPSGNIYVADTQNNRIRKITPLGVVTTFAGSGIGVPGFADGIGTNAQFNSPCGLCSDSFGNIYVADTGNQRIRKITSSGMVSTFAGSGAWGYSDGAGTAAQFYNPFGVCSDVLGNIYVVDSGNQRIRKITSSGMVSTFAGSGVGGYADGNGISAKFFGPNGICSDSSGNIYIAERLNRRIRKITSSGMVTTLAGSGVQGFADGTGTNAQFTMPHGIAVDPSGVIYVVDVNRIRKITPSGVVSTLAGSDVGGYSDGYGTAAQFFSPFGICTNSSGEIFVSDRNNNRIRKILLCNTTANITYSNNSLCNTLSFQQPVTLTGTGGYTGGTFSSTTGLSINATTGAITPSASTPETYTVTYTKTESGGCITTATTQITIATCQNSGQGVTDADGNIYNTVIIGNQEWMSENLTTTKYCNGDVLPVNNSWPNGQWGNLTVGAWNFVGGSQNNYGKLYNWFAAVDSRNICPCNWHVPTDNEWTELENYLIANGFNYDGSTTGNKIAKSMASNSLQNLNWTSSTNIGAVGNNLLLNNSSGFNAKPEGSSWGSYGYTAELYTFWWTTNSWTTDNNYALWRGLSYQYNYLLSGAPDIGLKTAGFSIRCVKNAPSTPVSVTVPPYINCDSNSGFSVFDLTINNSIILAGQPAGSSNYFITYHETLTNANNGTNALVPENYFNIIPYNQTIYYRVVNPVTGEFAVGSIQLIVNDAPVAVVLNPIVVCDQDSNPQNAITLVNLTQQTAAVLAQQTQAASNYTVMYYTSLVSAQLGTAPILNDTNYFGSNLEMIWVRVEDVTTGCYNIGSFLLQINKPLLLTTPLPLSLCDDDASPNNLFHVFDLTYRDASITQGLTGYTVNYYPSIVDAQNGTNVILTPTAYQNVFPAVQTLGVVVTSSAGCRSITTLDIRVLPIPSPIINTANNVTTICVDFITNQVVRTLTLNSGVTSPSNYTFQWFEGTSTTPIPGATGPSYTVNTPSPTGATRDYTVKVTSNSPSACQTTSLPFSVIQSGQAAIPIGTIGFTVTSPFSSSQTITVNIEGYGAPDYQYSLDDGPRQTSNVFENVSLGTHVIHVWDTKGDIAYSCEELIIFDVQILGVSDTEILPLQFAPNPVKTNLELQSTIVLQSVIIYNVLGQKVYEKIINDTSAILDLSNLKTGNYLVKIDAETGQKVIRIVKD